ncbi:MAG: dephospho-CoA kinase [Candidatus Diapherotrites archaeon CG11_big_fil_rev_8_21_14_0_20_37_9]|nr:MAG: dephospho-CoA kinase [Candidatus Diapherotrites archaeon CG11_big_fil_rev_8_21_14_0_20_37_9]
MLIAITGNFGSGKSSVRRMIESHNFKTIDCDRMVDELYYEKEIIAKMKEIFGPTIALDDKIDKQLLSAIIFNNPEKLKKVNAFMHPLVKEKIIKYKETHKEEFSKTLFFIEVPLLFEAKMETLFDYVVLIKTEKELAKSRSVNKGYTEAEFERIVATQEPPEKNEKKADYVIDTGKSFDDTRKQVEELLEKLSKKKAFE